MALRVRSFGMSDVGLARDNNEDAFLVDEVTGLYLVADGMGGHASGEVASRLACENVFRVMRTARQSPDFSFPFEIEENRSFEENALSNSIKVANQKIYDASSEVEEYRGMGTTIVALLEDPNRMISAHVGDSRVYRLRDGEITQLTSDHSLLNHYMQERGMTYEEASRLTESNVILRAVGLKEWTEVDINVFDKTAGDTFLLCSDGLSDQVPDPVIQEVMNRHGDNHQPACEELIKLANDAGGNDNCTILLVRVYEDGEDATSMPRPPGRKGLGDAPPPPPSRGARRGPAPPPSAAARAAKAMRQSGPHSPVPRATRDPSVGAADVASVQTSLPSVIIDMGGDEENETAVRPGAQDTQPLSRKALERYAARATEQPVPQAPSKSQPAPVELAPPAPEPPPPPAPEPEAPKVATAAPPPVPEASGPSPDLDDDDAATSLAVQRPALDEDEATAISPQMQAQMAAAVTAAQVTDAAEASPPPGSETPGQTPGPAPGQTPGPAPVVTAARGAAAVRQALGRVLIRPQPKSGAVDDTTKLPRITAAGVDAAGVGVPGSRVGVATPPAAEE